MLLPGSSYLFLAVRLAVWTVFLGAQAAACRSPWPRSWWELTIESEERTVYSGDCVGFMWVPRLIPNALYDASQVSSSSRSYEFQQPVSASVWNAGHDYSDQWAGRGNCQIKGRLAFC